MIFSHNFKQFSRISLLAVALLIIQPRETKAADPVTTTIVASWIISKIGPAILVIATEESIRYFLSPSKDQREYDARHAVLKDQDKEYFINTINALIKSIGLNKAKEKILSNHELYRYPNFIEALKNTFPEYADYIKNLVTELAKNYKKRKIRGFKRIYKCNIISRELPGHNAADDYFEFYELIKTLYQEILDLEQIQELCLLILDNNVDAINQRWDTLNKNLLYQALFAIGPNEHNSSAYTVLKSLLSLHEKETAELHSIAAILLLSEPNPTIDSYQEALIHMQTALSLAPNDIFILENFITFSGLAKKFTVDAENTPKMESSDV